MRVLAITLLLILFFIFQNCSEIKLQGRYVTVQNSSATISPPPFVYDAAGYSTPPSPQCTPDPYEVTIMGQAVFLPISQQFSWGEKLFNIYVAANMCGNYPDIQAFNLSQWIAGGAEFGQGSISPRFRVEHGVLALRLEITNKRTYISQLSVGIYQA